MADTKTKPAKKTAPKKAAEHPKYLEMVLSSVSSLKERTGSSRQAISKYIHANYKVKDNADVHIKRALKKGVSDEMLTQPKGTGASGSFKINVKKTDKSKKPAVKKIAKKKTPIKKKAPAKKGKKPTPKKSITPAKKVVKKTTKKSSAKKAKRTVAKKPAAKKVAKPKKSTPKKKSSKK
jgi:hypothetical protein